MSINQISQLKNSVHTLKFLAQYSAVLSKDQTPMPDGSGSVATAFALAVAELEIPYLQLLENVPAEVLKAIAAKASFAR